MKREKLAPATENKNVVTEFPPVVIGERSFRTVTNSTSQNDVFNRSQFSRSGLIAMEMREDESAEEFAVRTIDALALNADVYLLLGGLLHPVELEATEWTPAVAEETAQFLRVRTAPEDKAKINKQIVDVVMAFLRAGLISLTVSPKSST